MQNFTQKYIESFDKKQICVYKNTVYQDSGKTIIVVHGMAEHIERYEEFLNKLLDNGYNIIAYNQRGHFLTDSEENYGFRKI